MLCLSTVDNKNKVKNLLVVGGSTLLSRLLGLLRDVLVYAALGTSVYNSAFILAFTLPNLFRRLFGEGALTSALIPVLAQASSGERERQKPRIFDQVLTRLVLGLGAMMLILMAGFAVCSMVGVGSERWQMGARYGVWLAPYMLLVCVTAVMAAALNLLGRFYASSLSPVWLNLAMIAAACLPLLMEDMSLHMRVIWLCWAVLLGGVVQVGLVWVGLNRCGWRPSWDTGTSVELSRVASLLIPGLSAASILQVNILLTRLFANSIDDGAVAVLYLASRFMELPLGLFAIAISTVFFPLMSKALAAGNRVEMSHACFQGLRWICFMTLPSAVGLWIYQREIVDALFRYGVFDGEALTLTAPIVGIYALSIPAYAAVSYFTRALHAQEDMKGPMQISGINLLLNAAFCLVGIALGGLAGLALGNVAAAWVQCLLLGVRLFRVSGGGMVVPQGFVMDLFKILISACLMGLGCMLGLIWVSGFGLSEKSTSLLIVGLGIPLAIAGYFGALLMLRQRDVCSLLVRLFQRVNPHA